jgi:carboxyl-terminal processing protease
LLSVACSVARGGGSVALPGERGGAWRGGVGAVFRYGASTRTLTVHEAPSGGAAARAGIHAGDVVVAIDGVALTTLEQHEVVARLRGEVGTTVTLRVRRDGAERDVRVERGPYGRRERD